MIKKMMKENERQRRESPFMNEDDAVVQRFFKRSILYFKEVTFKSEAMGTPELSTSRFYDQFTPFPEKNDAMLHSPNSTAGIAAEKYYTLQIFESQNRLLG
uniref:Uncharacterized protein n=1 Tax=Romanomermis culicivorax TaxID=13658 RepID=A0A915L1M1_ROMCU